jgi:hypothetical protein
MQSTGQPFPVVRWTLLPLARLMATTYPFQLRNELVEHLPPPAVDGHHYIDVLVRGTWDGILVVDSKGMCLGIHVRRRVEEFPLPFDASQIEDVRPACLGNRVQAQIPFDLFAGSLVVVFLVSPVLFVIAGAGFPRLSVVPVVFGFLSLYGLYQARGFPFIRPFAALFALVQLGIGTALLLS